MRVATMSIYSNSKFELSRTLSGYTKAADTVITGKRVQNPSDDPVGYAQVMDIDSTLSQLDQLESNIGTGMKWLNTSESTMDSILDTISAAKQLSIAATNGTYNDQDYASASAQVDGLLAELAGYANSSVNGLYLFSGTRTDTSPYEVDADAVAPDPMVSYFGNDDPFTIGTGIGSRTEVSYTGNDVFGDVADPDGDGFNNDLFSLLIRMSEDLSTNSGGDLDAIMTELDTHFDNVNNLISDVGIKTNRLETKENVIANLKLTLTEQKSNIEDVDLAEAATDLALQETAYQAALSATSSIISISLVDYL
jgi:flagellar hook-associated protein 3 FlgL